MKKQVIVDETLGDVEPTTGAELIEQRKDQFQSKRGAKLIGAKPKGAIRVLVDAKIRTNRPKNIYKETVTDADDGTAKWVLWWLTEQSDYHGIEEIVKYNPKTEEELTQGYDYTIPFTVEAAKDLIKKSFGATNFYLKDGVNTYTVQHSDLETLFLKDHKPGMKAVPVSK